MTCEETRAALLAGGEAGWPSGVTAHIAGCDGCATVAVELSLQRAPAFAIPPTFAVDVARRARLDTPDLRRGIGAAAGFGALAVLVALAAFGAAVGTDAVAPAAALLLACGEAIVLVAWALDTDVTHTRLRR